MTIKHVINKFFCQMVEAYTCSVVLSGMHGPNEAVEWDS